MTATEQSRYPAAGEVIDGKYRIDRMLGEGGMGAVAGAFHLLRRAPVALKFISPDVVRVPGAVDRFVNEAVAASQIDSDHVVRIFDVGQLTSGLPYIVMEMMSGCDLSELLEREGQGGGLQLERSVHFVLQILRALQVAHGAGIIHRDLKPSNAFVVVKDGEGDFVKLLDFGISKITQDASESQQHLTQTNTGLGTPLYMSPEQARNARDATAKSDLYSVSAILYELLTGRTPYLAASPNDLLFKLFTAEPDPIKTVRPDVPDALARVIHQGLSKDPDQRPADATDMAELLIPFADARSAGIITRLRSASGGARTSVTSGQIAPIRSVPGAGLALDRTMVASNETTGGAAVAQTSSTPRKTGGTQLNMGVSEASIDASAPAAGKKGGMKLVVGAVAALAIVGGGLAMVAKGSGPAPASGVVADARPSAIVPAPPVSEVAPAKSAPEVVPVVASVTAPVASVAASAEPPKPKVAGRVPGPMPGGPAPALPQKKSPFDVGIVR
jgi:eukaryotic-like serine/threonine-protein kinase